jgi:diguanylate cyclase (GGDEF)-like protein
MQAKNDRAGWEGASCRLPWATAPGDLALFPERNPRPVLLVTGGGRVTYGNPAARETAQRLLGAGAGLASLVPAGLGARLRALWSSPADDGCFELAVAERTLLCSVHLLRDRGLAHAYLADVTEERRVERDLFRARRQDALTGLGNRLSFEDRLEQALGDRGEGAVGVLLLDVDRLRRVNDGLGHAAGDELLREAGRRLSEALPGLTGARGEAFRFEGDTFAVLASDLHDARSSPARLATRHRVSSSGAPWPVARPCAADPRIDRARAESGPRRAAPRPRRLPGRRP